METLGWRFVPDDQELVEYLHHRSRGHTLSSSGAINEDVDPYGCRPEKLQNVSMNGSYYYANRDARNRQTADGIGYWKSTDGQQPIHKHGQIVGYKRNLRFYLRPKNSTKWVMTEYTLHPDTTHDALKAICVIRTTAGDQRNEKSKAIHNSLIPEPDEEDICGQLSPLLELDGKDSHFLDLTDGL